LVIPLYMQETLLKYIGGLHSYLRHTILMFNPTNFDEVCVQATHIESRGKNVQDDFSKKPVQSVEGKNKGKGKEKRKTTMKIEYDKPSCSHCKKKGHDDAKCWKLHPELKPKWFKDKKGNKKTTTIIQEDLGSYSGDETKIMAIRLQGISFSANSSSNTHSLNIEMMPDEKKRSELFHIRVISKQTKIDTLFDSGSQEIIFLKKLLIHWDLKLSLIQNHIL
jgi:ribosomal protein S8E